MAAGPQKNHQLPLIKSTKVFFANHPDLFFGVGGTWLGSG